MNKQQLAAKIWASANKMRSKIEANEYKDYILGLIFYKYVSDNEVSYLKNVDGWGAEDIATLKDDPENPDDVDIMNHLKQSIGYFISYENLFSTWLLPDVNFSVSVLSNALSDFERHIDSNFKEVYHGIFDSLKTGLSKLGSDTNSQTKAIKDLLKLIKDIPTDNKQGYDVLGYVYEYLIGNFAANAGKKAGEFYTPHEVAIVMAEIVADHHKGKETIGIYDPTSGSGSLLINIGRSLGRHMADTNKIKYYAQELKENTYNLTRMNLVMRNILPINIVSRCADSLGEDWPMEVEGSNIGKPLYVDAVVSNPPYSQEWDTTDMEHDARFKNYGIAPKKKADYAFLLHELHHLKPDGILTIVLPHGVLFRGNKEDGSEGQIRMNLIEKNNIDAIIGLPAGIFFGTGIPTLIMVLKQRRDNDDVLIIDASKGFIKDGKQNRLRACDIKRITDAIRDRADVPGFSRKVSREEIRKNDYNLNIPRYVDSSEKAVKYDIYATMFGSIPNSEIDDLQDYWNHMDSLRGEIFQSVEDKPYSTLRVANVHEAVSNSNDVRKLRDSFDKAFENLDSSLHTRLIDNLTKVSEINEGKELEAISDELFDRMKNLPIVNNYSVYQVLADNWSTISTDIETFQQDGNIEACRAIDQATKIKKDKDGNEIEVPDGLKGRIMPFELIQAEYFAEDLQTIKSLETRQEEITNELESLRDSLSEEDADALLNEDNTKFDIGKVMKQLSDLFEEIHTTEIDAVRGYIDLLDKKAKKNEKLDYIINCKEVDWDLVERSKDGTLSAKSAKQLLFSYYWNYRFPEDSLGYVLVSVSNLFDEEKSNKKTLNVLTANIEENTIAKIESLTDEECHHLLHIKWINPIVRGISTVFDDSIKTLSDSISELADKYSIAYNDINEQIYDSEQSLKALISELTGDEFAINGLSNLINK